MYNLSGKAQRIKFVREASEVQRHHARPPLKSQNIGEHTFNMLGMLRILDPNCSIYLVWAILEHDVPERVIGDTPAPVKWYGLTDEDKVQQMEREVNQQVFDCHFYDSLTDHEKSWLSGLDLLEYYCFCRDEIHRGNKNFEKVLTRVDRVFEERREHYPSEIVEAYKELQNMEWDQLDDLGDNR